MKATPQSSQKRTPPKADPPKPRMPKPVAPENRAKPGTVTKQGRGEGGVRVASADFSAGAAKKEQVPPTSKFDDAPEIAFAGRSNVGKSSLLNMMLSRKGLARTSNTPGCTRQINFFDVGLAQKTAEEAAAAGKPELPKRVIFVDLPGYGYAKVSKTENRAWQDLLESYLKERPTLKAVVVLVDVRRGLEQEEEELVEFLEQRPELKLLIVATKLDKLPLSAQKPTLAKMPGAPQGNPKRPVVATSAETGEGRDRLWGRIFDACRVH